MQFVPAKAPAFERARPEILNEHVAVCDELANNVLTFRGAKIERQRFFVARLCCPPYRRPFVKETPFAQGIARNGGLDFGDLRAEFSEHLSCKWPSDELTHFEHADAVKWLRHGCLL